MLIQQSYKELSMSIKSIFLPVSRSFDRKLLITICASIFMSKDKNMSPKDAVGDAIQIYDLVCKSIDK